MYFHTEVQNTSRLIRLRSERGSRRLSTKEMGVKDLRSLAASMGGKWKDFIVVSV